MNLKIIKLLKKNSCSENNKMNIDKNHEIIETFNDE